MNVNINEVIFTSKICRADQPFLTCIWSTQICFWLNQPVLCLCSPLSESQIYWC